MTKKPEKELGEKSVDENKIAAIQISGLINNIYPLSVCMLYSITIKLRRTN